MRIKILLLAVVLTGLLFTLSASAKLTDEECGIVPITPFNYLTTTDIPKFDQNLGELNSVKLTVRDACGYISNAIDSEDPLPRNYTFFFTGMMIPNLPIIGEKTFVIGTPPGGLGFAAAADDEPGKGNPDWAGPDYKLLEVGTEAVPVCAATQVFPYYTATEKAPFIGNEGDVLTISIRTDSSFAASGGGEYAAEGETSMGITICVVYDYTPKLCINGTKTDACTGDGLSDWEICLSNSSGYTACTTTDENGEYSFCGLVPGSYTVSETPQAGWKPVGQTSITVPLDVVSREDINFVNEPPFCISGYKYNGTTGEEGLSGWTIQLKDASGAVINTTTTGADGSYQFCGLFRGTYTVCEVTQPNWTPIGPTCITVNLNCADSEDNNFRNTRVTNPPCGPLCPWFIKNELYTADCTAIKVVGADKGLLSNEMFSGVVVLNPESITIDPKFGNITVEEDGSFVYDPTGATALSNGAYVIFKYAANNGLCDAKYKGIAKIQVRCK